MSAWFWFAANVFFASTAILNGYAEEHPFITACNITTAIILAVVLLIEGLA